MNILNAVYGDSTGGRWNATLKTAELLAGKGHVLTLLIDPCDRHKLPDAAARPYDVVAMRNSGHYDLLASWKARRLMRERGIDAVIAHSGRAIHLLKRAAPRNVPVIAFNHSHNIKRTLKADAFFCITPYMKQIVDCATGAAKPAFVISNAVSVPPAEQLHSGGERPFTIGAMARMAPNKGLRHLVVALGLLREAGVDFRATIAGDGEERAALAAMLGERGLAERVEMPGWLNGEQKQAFFNGIDVLCFTSEHDVQPLTILEAFAWGKALVGTDVDGPSSCYEDGQTALVVPPADPQALAAALLRLHREPALRARLGENARRRAIEAHSDAVVADMLDQRVRELVAAHGGVRP